VLISTHIVSDVESIASDILLMKKGKIIKNDTPTALIHSIKDYVKEIPIDDLYYKKIKNHYKDGVFMQRSGGLQYRIVTDDKMDSQFTLDEEHINLEDVYLYYVQ
jgi:ABC-type multidrug transport system ATPase subunit